MTTKKKDHKREGYNTPSVMMNHVRSHNSTDSTCNPIGIYYVPGPCTGFEDKMHFLTTLSSADSPYTRYLKETFQFYEEPSKNTSMIIIKGVSHAEWIMFRIKMLLEDTNEYIYDFGGQRPTLAMKFKAVARAKFIHRRLHSVHAILKVLRGRYSNNQTGTFFTPNATYVCVQCNTKSPPSPVFINACPTCHHSSTPYGNMLIHDQSLVWKIVHGIGGLPMCNRLSENEMAKLSYELISRK